jgi:CBS domain-containing protein
MKVREAMTAVPVTIRAGETAEAAAACMARHRVRHLPVVDAHGALEGVVTDRDLRHCLLSPAVMDQLGHVPVTALLAKVPVRDVMASPVVVTTPETELPDAVAVMRDRRVGSLAVVEGPRLVGIITETDLLRRVMALDTIEPRATPDDDDVVAIVVSYP